MNSNNITFLVVCPYVVPFYTETRLTLMIKRILDMRINYERHAGFYLESLLFSLWENLIAML